MITENNKNVNIILTGGGTGGPVTPLLAIADRLKNEANYDFFWIGTHEGPEKQMVEHDRIKFISICSGKLRRYFSLKNFIDPFFILLGFIQSVFIILKQKPSLVMSAGGFVSVPVVWAARIMRVPVLIHQQDVRPGLANKLMAPFACIITTTFEKSLKDYGKKARWVGNPVRNIIDQHKMSRREAAQKLGIREDLPTVLVLGGGTGSQAINDLVKNNLEELTKFCQIIHLVGAGKGEGQESIKNYRVFEFLDVEGMIKVYTVANAVVSRCGMGVLTELSALAKPSILIPMPNSHQEDNARVFEEARGAIVLDQNKISGQEFVEQIKQVIKDQELNSRLSENIEKVMKKNASESIVEVIKDLV